MSGSNFDRTKKAVLSHMLEVFEQMEEDIALSHQEKYALLEDLFEQASDSGELRVAFDQWYIDHSDDLQFESDADELWDHATNQEEDEDYDGEQDVDGDIEDEDDEEW